MTAPSFSALANLPPPSAGVRIHDDPDPRLELKPASARWVIIAGWCWPLPALVGLALIVHSATLLPRSPFWASVGLATGLAIEAVAFVFAVIGLSRLITYGRLRIHADIVAIEEMGRRFEIPRNAIRGLAVVQRKPRWFDFDVDLQQAPRRFFSRRDGNALELELSEGRIWFFKPFEQRDVHWVARALAHLLDLPLREYRATSDDTRTAAAATGTYGRDRVFATCLGLAAGTAVLAFASWFVGGGLRAARWPTIEGTVTLALYEVRGTGSDATARTEIRYAYTVDGRPYENDRFGYGFDGNNCAVKRIVQDHPAGSKITVFYDPSSPGRSVLIPRVHWIGWLIVATGLLFLALSLPACLAGPRHDLAAILRPYLRRPTPRATPDDAPPLVAWSPAPEVAIAARRRTRRELLRVSISGSLATGGAIAVLYYLANYGGLEIRQTDVIAAVAPLALFVIPLLACLAYLAFGERTPREYRLTDEGLAHPGLENPLIRWHEFSSFRVQVNPDLLAHRNIVLTLNDKRRRSRTIPLPGDARDSIILAALSDHLPEDLSLRP